jgi:hypothetical protein
VYSTYKNYFTAKTDRWSTIWHHTHNIWCQMSSVKIHQRGISRITLNVPAHVRIQILFWKATDIWWYRLRTTKFCYVKSKIKYDNCLYYCNNAQTYVHTYIQPQLTRFLCVNHSPATKHTLQYTAQRLPWPATTCRQHLLLSIPTRWAGLPDVTKNRT